MKFFSLNANICMMLILFVGCRTSTPKSTNEVLSGRDVKDKQQNMNEIMTDEGSSANESSAMWSPASRRANAMFRYLVAQKSVFEGDIKLAEENFEASYNLDPNSYTGGKIVRAKLISDPKNPDALTEARRMSLLYPRDANLRLMFGHALLNFEEYKEAEINIKKAIELDPKFEDAFVELVKLYQFQKLNDQAITTAKKFVAAVPNRAISWSTLSRILISEKKFKEALEPSKKAWEFQENNLESALIYALVLDLNKRGKEAVKLYEQLYRFNPGNNELMQRMVMLYKELGNLNNALSLIDDMIEHSKDEVPGLKMQKIIILWEVDRNDEALRISRELEAELPESDRVYFMSGFAHLKMGLKVEAIARFEKIQNESHLKIDGMKQQVLILSDLGRTDEALAVAKQICERSEADPIGFMLWSEILADVNRFSEAIQVIDRALEKFPNNEKLLFSKGAYQERSGNKKAAEVTMKAVIDVNPQNSAALNFLGYMYAEENRNLEEAESLVRRAIEIQPKNGGFLDSLGWIFYRKKMYKKALEILETATKLDPEEGVILEHIGDVLIGLGEDIKAKEQYGQALKRKLDKPDKDRIQGKFDGIKDKSVNP